ncbi:MAG: asparagine--tRNA ligase [Thaumarchaeota archaeon]|nr:asparagine--tRNA ligase [Candidatus Calditenuaceae archaeon]MDW8042055.1 asparagine--tRNA ligase [Nitrososphaerota archaeon]
MRRTVRDLASALEGEPVELWGWIWNKREHGKLVFVDLRDWTGVVQVAARAGLTDHDSLQVLRSLSRESSVRIFGTVVRDPRAPGGIEVRCSKAEAISPSTEDFPIRKGMGSKALYDHRHLHIRSPRMSALMRIRSNLVWSVHEFFRSREFVEVDCPTIITAAVEGGATLFEVNYLGRKAYLTQSVQFYQEAAIFGLGKVYSVQPSFRAELSRTPRHLTEFWHVEGEMAFCDLEGLMRTIEDLVRFVVLRTEELSRRELDLLRRRIRTEEVEGEFYRVRYSEALEVLRRAGREVEWGSDLGADEERIISSQFDRPLFITHYPKEAKAFYHKSDPEDPRVTLSTDLLAPRGNGEIVGAGVRIDDHEELLSRIRNSGLNPEDYGWYVDLRKYGSVPHAGFGMGVERVLKWILDLPHVRMASLFPRTPTRLYP